VSSRRLRITPTLTTRPIRADGATVPLHEVQVMQLRWDCVYAVVEPRLQRCPVGQWPPATCGVEWIHRMGGTGK
jgi:hypothetical protein